MAKIIFKSKELEELLDDKKWYWYETDTEWGHADHYKNGEIEVVRYFYDFCFEHIQVFNWDQPGPGGDFCPRYGELPIEDENEYLVFEEDSYDLWKKLPEETRNSGSWDPLLMDRLNEQAEGKVYEYLSERL